MDSRLAVVETVDVVGSAVPSGPVPGIQWVRTGPRESLPTYRLTNPGRQEQESESFRHILDIWPFFLPCRRRPETLSRNLDIETESLLFPSDDAQFGSEANASFNGLPCSGLTMETYDTMPSIQDSKFGWPSRF